MVHKAVVIALMMTLMAFQGCGYENYDECVLGEMKGQQVSMRETAERVCERKFPYEKEIYSFMHGDIDIDFTGVSRNSVSIAVSKNETEYRITKAIMKFSKISCEESRDKDFTARVEFKFTKGKTAAAHFSGAEEFKCMKKESTFGIME